MHLAQFNYAILLTERDNPQVAEFFERLDEVNQLAEDHPGFVWRLQDEAGDSLAINPYGDQPLAIVNMSVWKSVESLKEYTYQSGHIEVFRKRRAWFEKNEKSPLVMWWIPEGEIPDAEEGRTRLEYLWEHGPSERAFTFKALFAPPE